MRLVKHPHRNKGGSAPARKESRVGQQRSPHAVHFRAAQPRVDGEEEEHGADEAARERGEDVGRREGWARRHSGAGKHRAYGQHRVSRQNSEDSEDIVKFCSR